MEYYLYDENSSDDVIAYFSWQNPGNFYYVNLPLDKDVYREFGFVRCKPDVFAASSFEGNEVGCLSTRFVLPVTIVICFTCSVENGQTMGDDIKGQNSELLISAQIDVLTVGPSHSSKIISLDYDPYKVINGTSRNFQKSCGSSMRSPYLSNVLHSKQADG